MKKAYLDRNDFFHAEVATLQRLRPYPTVEGLENRGRFLAVERANDPLRVNRPCSFAHPMIDCPKGIGSNSPTGSRRIWRSRCDAF
jgi:hypothetical protein